MPRFLIVLLFAALNLNVTSSVAKAARNSGLPRHSPLTCANTYIQM